MSAQNIRLSRISHPRGTAAALVLLVVFFLSFGIIAEACTDVPAVTAEATTLQSAFKD